MTLEELIHSSHVPLLFVNRNHNFLYTDPLKKKAQLEPESLQKAYAERGLDHETQDAIQLLDLFNKIGYAKSRLGQAVLLRDMVQPSDSLELITAKQDSLRELEGNKGLRKALNDYISFFTNVEYSFFHFFSEFHMSPYKPLRAMRTAVKALVESSKSLPQPDSPYLATLVNDIQALEASPIFRYMSGNFYSRNRKLMQPDDVGFFSHARKFTPRHANLTSAGLVLYSFLPVEILSQTQSAVGHLISSVIMLASLMGGMIYAIMVKPMIDESKAVSPLRNMLINDEDFTNFVEGIGRIDELLSFYKFGQKAEHPVVIPNMVNRDSHYLAAEDMANPFYFDDASFVRNSLELDKILLFLSGPNSGGKSTLCRTITQNQILAQIGSYVLASSAEITPADFIFYQNPSFDALEDEQGRFGTELKRTRDIFYAVSPRSFVVLDELAEGTTYEERMEVSTDILDGFYKMGNTTILVTHNHALAQQYRNRGVGQHLMAQFVDENPTYVIIEGISTVSHASRIASQIGFSREDIAEHLRRVKGSRIDYA